MDIKIKTLSGRIIQVRVNENYTVSHIKKIIQDLEGVNPSDLKIIHNSKILSDDLLLCNCDINDNSVLRLILKLRASKIEYDSLSDDFEEINFSVKSQSHEYDIEDRNHVKNQRCCKIS